MILIYQPTSGLLTHSVDRGGRDKGSDKDKDKDKLLASPPLSPSLPPSITSSSPLPSPLPPLLPPPSDHPLRQSFDSTDIDKGLFLAQLNIRAQEWIEVRPHLYNTIYIATLYSTPTYVLPPLIYTPWLNIRAQKWIEVMARDIVILSTFISTHFVSPLTTHALAFFRANLR